MSDADGILPPPAVLEAFDNRELHPFTVVNGATVRVDHADMRPGDAVRFYWNGRPCSQYLPADGIADLDFHVAAESIGRTLDQDVAIHYTVDRAGRVLTSETLTLHILPVTNVVP